MQTVELNVYQFQELKESAKDKAREWYRNGYLNYDWWDSVEEGFKEVCNLMGVTVERSYFSGFHSQGDGASFVGSYVYVKGSTKAVKEYAPQDKELNRIAQKLQAIQRRNFYSLSASISQSGHYVHEMTMRVSVDRDSDNYQDMTNDAEDTVTEAMRDLAVWYYRALEKEYEWLMSDEHIDESIVANEYTFTGDGKLWR